MIEYTKPLDDKAIFTDVTERIERYARMYDVYVLVCKLLVKFEGKKVTKRIQTYLQEHSECSKYNPYMREIASMVYLHVNLFTREEKTFSSDKRSNNEVEFLLCYTSDPIFSMEKFKERTKGYRDNPSQIQSMNEVLPLIPAWVQEWNIHLEALKNIHRTADTYGISTYFEVKN